MARSSFASKFGAMAAVAGSAVGLGNIWRFPYVAGSNGGAAFLIIYTVICVLIALPVMLSELLIGRKGQSNVYRSYMLCSGSKMWAIMGGIGVLTGLAVLAFYSVVAGWSLEYIFASLQGEFAGVGETSAEVLDERMAAMSNRFDTFVLYGGKYLLGIPRPIFWTLLFLALNCIVLAFGVSKGIERCSKVMIPALFLLLVVLVLMSVRLDGFAEGAMFLLKPNWSAVTPQTFIDALGQAFFSLSIGMGAMITYGSYLPKDQNLFTIAFTVMGATVVMAVLAGLAIFPSTFTYGVEVTSGPGLVFKTLPALFASTPGAQWVGVLVSVLFFILLFFAAVTSSFSLLETGTAFLVEEFTFKGKKLSRSAVLAILFVAVGGLSVLCALSQMADSSLVIMGRTLFDFLDKLTADIIMPLGGIAVCILVGWWMERSVVYNELTGNGKSNVTMARFLIWLVRWVSPVAIAYLFMRGLMA